MTPYSTFLTSQKGHLDGTTKDKSDRDGRKMDSQYVTSTDPVFPNPKFLDYVTMFHTCGLSTALKEWKDGLSKFGGFSTAYAPSLLYFGSPNCNLTKNGNVNYIFNFVKDEGGKNFKHFNNKSKNSTFSQ